MMVGALSLLLLADGCGGGGEPAPTVAAEDAPAKAVDVKQLVFQADDLPGVRGVESPFAEPCGPMSVLEEAGGRAVLSERYLVWGGEAVEAAAVFRGEEAARSAHRALDEPERLRCIASAIGSLGPQLVIKFDRPASLAGGDEATVTRYRIIDSESPRRGYSNVIALRVGRCTASILVVSEGEEEAARLTRSVSRTAAGLLTRPCG